MGEIYTWVKSLIVGYCLLELLGHLVNQREYQRYVRFFGGLALLFILLSPAAKLFSLGDGFDEELQRAFLQEEAGELSLSWDSLAELGNSRIFEAYQAELERQMGEIAKAYGRTAGTVDITFAEEDGASAPTQIAGVAMTLEPEDEVAGVSTEDAGSSAQSIAAEISAVYGVERERVVVRSAK